MAWTPYVYGFVPRDPQAFALFANVDTSRSNALSLHDVRAALKNGGYKFNRKTARKLMRMHDTNQSQSLGYVEFENMWGKLQQWQHWFQHADRDRSGNLSLTEVCGAVRNFGFNLPDAVLSNVFAAYDDDGSGNLQFEQYIALLSELNALTALFRLHDRAGTGSANLDFTTFLSIVYTARS
jgi:Ca2+-binding EF-hand superfamily protein